MTRFWLLFPALIFTASCDKGLDDVIYPSKIVDGYSDRTSYDLDDTIHFYLNAKKEKEDVDIKISTINGVEVAVLNADLEPQEPRQNKPYEVGFGYDLTASYIISGMLPGLYLLDEQIPFIVKTETPREVVVLYSSNTENAYAKSGGKSMYESEISTPGPARITSFHRPIKVARHSKAFYEWLAEQNSWSISYICDRDMDDYSNLDGAKLLVIPGHSEYWTRKARKNFDRFVAEGNNALILSGNSMWWQVRYGPNSSQMICYKTMDDPITNPLLKTVNWSNPSLDYSIVESIGLDFDYGGYGVKYDDLGWDGFKMLNVDYPFLKDVKLEVGDVIRMPTFEYDGAPLEVNSNGQVGLSNTYNFHRYELIAYDLAYRGGHTNGAWILLQKEESSGVIINAGSTDWCSKEGIGGKDHKLVKEITTNMIDYLLND